MSKRALYTDDEDKIYTFRRCIALNGINVVATREDLLDRSILLELERISPENRKDEATIWKEFEEAKPYILGAIFDIVAKAMKIHPEVKLEKLPRLADFARYGFAIAEAMGGKGEEFLREYSYSVEKQSKEALAANPVASTIVHLMMDGNPWTGTAVQLLNQLEVIADNDRIDRSFFPKSANALTRKLNAIKSNLQDSGISFSSNNDGHNKRITIKKEHQEMVEVEYDIAPFA